MIRKNCLSSLSTEGANGNRREKKLWLAPHPSWQLATTVSPTPRNESLPLRDRREEMALSTGSCRASAKARQIAPSCLDDVVANHTSPRKVLLVSQESRPKLPPIHCTANPTTVQTAFRQSNRGVTGVLLSATQQP
jgi:hypothetical protein